jgi:starch-binding outer membrane protein, SusD/RagB family
MKYLHSVNTIVKKSFMMKTTNKICLVLAFVSILFTSYSCKDDFFTEPAGSRITPDKHYQSQTDLQISTMGACVLLQNVLPNLLLVDGLRSDLMDVASGADGYMKAINNQTFSVNNPYIDGSYYYKVIININEILANMDRVWVKDPPTTAAYIPKYWKGSLITIRAWCYFTLVRLYGEAAIINDNLASLPADKQTILQKSVMIDTLINQLKSYIFTSTLYTEYAFWGPNTKALLGELLLENHQYDSAAYYLKLGMESYGNRKTFGKVAKDFLSEKWKTIFYTDFPDAKGNENIFAIPYDSRRNQLNNFTYWSLKNMIKPTQLLVDSFNTQIQSTKAAGIGDKFRGKGITFDTLPGSNTDYYISKYNLIKSDPYSAFIIISRAADIHLLLAEALNQIGDTATALILLNAGIYKAKPTPAAYSKWSDNQGIRGRVILKSRTIPANIDKSNPQAVKDAVEDMILSERALELAFEGKRWFDLVRVAERRNIVSPGTGSSYLANKVAAKFSDPAKAEQIRNILSDPTNWYLPKN